LSSRKHTTRLVLPVAFLMVGLTALSVFMMSGGPAGAAAPVPSPRPSAIAAPAATASPAATVSPSASPASTPGSASSAAPAGAFAPASSAARRVTAARATAVMDAFDRAFYVEHDGRGFFRASTTSGGYAAFWRTAEMIELVEDAADRSGDPAYARMAGELTRGVFLRWGGHWTVHRRYNDDVMWMVLAFVRASAITGDEQLRDVAKRNFDAVFARAWSADLGGGLWWTSDRREKNTCVNAPAAIAAVRLSRALGDPGYLAKARRLYAWVRRHLYDSQTGAVYDHIFKDDDGQTVVDRATYSYNQGTFAGAGSELFRATHDSAYLGDAGGAIAFTRSDLTKGGVLHGEGGGDGGGFKGIFARYAGDYLRHDPARTYEGWLAQNADAAWSHRNTRGLMGQDWAQPTPDGELRAFDASSAVVLFEELRGR
jgi:predicted alpha-1,6-mannanase (GH76 family)